MGSKWLLWSGAGTGALLSLGAPLGYLLFSFVFLNPDQPSFLPWCEYVVRHQTALLVYLTVPTFLVFSVFGYYHGLQETKLAFKTEQMEHFLNVAAHDIRSPLSVIAEAAALLADKTMGEVNGEQEKTLRIIHNQTNVIKELTEELLDIYRMEAGRGRARRQPTELVPLFERSLEEMAILIHKKSVVVEMHNELPQETKVFLDPFQMRQGFRNIIQNALRYVPAEGGKIEVGISFEKDQQGVQVAISNNGPPIPREKLARIFDKFEQAEERDQRLGVGLGLAIAKRVVQLHKGRVYAKNIDPTGVCFYICLPIS